AGRDDNGARHCGRFSVCFLPDWASCGERRFHVCDIKHFLDDVLQGGAELAQNLLCVHISLAHLRFHVRVDHIPLVIEAQLTGNVDRVTDLHGLSKAVRLLPGQSESFHIFFEKCHYFSFTQRFNRRTHPWILYVLRRSVVNLDRTDNTGRSLWNCGLLGTSLQWCNGRAIAKPVGGSTWHSHTRAHFGHGKGELRPVSSGRGTGTF